MTLFTNRRRFVQTLSASALSVIAAPVFLRKAQAAVPVICASLMGDDKPETKVWLKIAELVDAKLPGRFHFKIVKNSALGGEREVNEGMRLGSVHASLSTLSALSSWVPEVQLFDMPFLFRDAEHVQRAAQSNSGHEIREKLADQNFIAPDYINYGVRHLLGKEPFLQVAQVRNKRIRVIQSPLHVALWQALEALPVALPITETYDALSSGVVDTMDLTVSAYSGFRLFEVAPQVTMTGHIWSSGVIMFSKLFWQTCSQEEQEVLRQAVSDGAVYFNRLMREDENLSQQLAEKNGAVFSKLENRSEWEARAHIVWQKFSERVGGLDRIEALRNL